ncbi:unnamed protein product [Natator depressus]
MPSPRDGGGENRHRCLPRSVWALSAPPRYLAAPSPCPVRAHRPRKRKSPSGTGSDRERYRARRFRELFLPRCRSLRAGAEAPPRFAGAAAAVLGGESRVPSPGVSRPWAGARVEGEAETANERGACWGEGAAQRPGRVGKREILESTVKELRNILKFDKCIPDWKTAAFLLLLLLL